MSLISKHNYLKLGDSGKPVEYIQKRLDLPITGDYDQTTKDAVIAFQNKEGLGPDGAVGPITFAAMTDGKLEGFFAINSRTFKLIATGNPRSFGILDVFKCTALSGLPAKHPRITSLIKKHKRKDLNANTNYTTSEYTGVSEVGPIPMGTYTLKITNDMAFATGKTGGGWGKGAWFLDKGFWNDVGVYFEVSRGGFYLHEDGNGLGTGGCIGIQPGSTILQIQKIFRAYKKSGLGDLTVRVQG